MAEDVEPDYEWREILHTHVYTQTHTHIVPMYTAEDVEPDYEWRKIHTHTLIHTHTQIACILVHGRGQGDRSGS